MIYKGIGSNTRIDRHNMRMSKEALESAADQINSSGSVPSVGVEHDITIMPIGKVISARLISADDGEYELEITQDIFEECNKITFNDGQVFMECKSTIDKRPFTEELIDNNNTHFSYDRVNFSSLEELNEFLSSINQEYNVDYDIICRKSLIPDPEIIITISESILIFLGGKKLLGQVSNNIAKDIGDFYNFARNAMIKYAKYAIPKNRPITYVFRLVATPNIELVAIGQDVNLIMKSIEENELKNILKRVKDMEKKFKINRIQFLLDQTGEWEFNFLLTNEGTVIGTEKSYSRSARKMELMRET